MSREDHADPAMPSFPTLSSSPPGGVATLMPTLPAPPQRAAPPVVVVPSVGGPQGAYTPGQQAMHDDPAQVATPAKAPRAEPTEPPAWRRYVIGVLACVLAAGGGYAGYRRFVHFDATTIELPTFTAPPPTYGNASFHVVVKSDTDPMDARLDTDGTASVVHYTGTPGTPGANGDEYITDGKTVFLRSSTSGTWTKGPFDDSAKAYEHLTGQFRVVTLADVVSPAAEPYVRVVSDGTELVAGRMLHRYELMLYMARFQSAAPAAYNHWAPVVGGSADAPTRANFVVWVDANGVVWQEQSSNSDDSEKITLTLLEFSDQQYVPPYPTDFVDHTTPPPTTTADGSATTPGSVPGGSVLPTP